MKNETSDPNNSDSRWQVKSQLSPDNQSSHPPPIDATLNSPPAVDWNQLNADFGDDQCAALTRLRGYSIECVRAARDAKIIGSFRGFVAFPVEVDGRVVGVHYLWKPRRWAYYPEGTEVTPLFIGDPQTAKVAWVFESQWDALAVLDKYGWPGNAGFTGIVIFITRGAGNGAMVQTLRSNVDVINAFKQNDPPSPDRRPSEADKWLQTICKYTTCRVWQVLPPDSRKDWNDWTRAGATADHINEAILKATCVREPGVPAQEQAAATGSAPPGEPEGEALPVLTLPSGAVKISECAEHLFGIIAPTLTLFNRNRSLTEIIIDNHGQMILQAVTPQPFRSRIEQFVVCYRWVVRGGQPVHEPANVSEDTAKALLGCLALQLLPAIRGVLNCALIVPAEGGGCRVISCGYDAQTQLVVARGEEPPDVPLDEAVAKWKQVVNDFDFATPGDRSRALASFITPALKQGGHILGSVPACVGEANESQAGKGYLQKLLAAAYGEKLSVVPQKERGVGSDDESFNAELIKGKPFIQLDNRRGKFNSTHLEAFLTAEGLFPARVPYHDYVHVDPSAYFILITSNAAELTVDLANRSSFVRIRKRPLEYVYRQYPEGTILEHVRANQGYFLGCIFSVVRAWHAAGKARMPSSQHDFREWCQVLDWIVQNIFDEAPLMSGHEEIKERVSNPAITFARNVAVAVEKAGLFECALAANEIFAIAIEQGIEIPSFNHNGAEAGFKIVGQHMARAFKSSEIMSMDLDGYRIERTEQLEQRTDGKGNSPRRTYVFSRVKVYSTGLGGGVFNNPDDLP